MIFERELKNKWLFFSMNDKENNFISFPDGYHFDQNKFGVISENTILSLDIEAGEIKTQWGNNTSVTIFD
jgi:hypothetical protein